MKLIHKTSRYYLIYTLCILSVGTILFYFLIKLVLIHGIDEALHQEETQIVENLRYEKEFDVLKPSKNIFIRKIKTDHRVPGKYSTIQVYDSLGNTENYRELKAIYNHSGIYYEINIRQSLNEAETLLTSLIPAVALLFLFILVGVLMINNHISNKVWQPFYDIVDRLKKYEITKTQAMQYKHSEITEFNELSLSVEKMTNKIYKDFISQKEFNENSSHEMQTPLAIIRNKLELLIQSKNLTGEDLNLIEAVFEAVKRLSLLNKGLLLITKIENQQFEDIEKVDMNSLLKNTLANFNELIEEKELNVELDIVDSCVVDFNFILADILLMNLISNAIKHNIHGGNLYIELNENYLKIKNTGNTLDIAPEALFERFKKSSVSENSVGLGLSIVKKICEKFNFKIDYITDKNIHIITIHF